MTQIYQFPKPELQQLIDALTQQGYRVVGPTIRDSAILFDEIQSCQQLPIGWTDQQDGGKYRLIQGQTDQWFDFVVGANSIKNYTFPPRQTVLTGHQQADGDWKFEEPTVESIPTAILGARACDLAALSIQDRVFLGPDYRDASYAARRSSLLLIGVNCQRSVSTCFCQSMGTGPAIESGYDLLITELDETFLLQVATAKGATITADRKFSSATIEAREEAERRVQDLVQRMSVVPLNVANSTTASNHSSDQSNDRQESENGSTSPTHRHLDTSNIRDLLYSNLNHPHWDQIAERCLSCGNCTLVCPTCFCSTVEDVPSLDETEIRRERSWTSCFSDDHSYMSSGIVRQTTRARYRQWLTHKLGGWIDQFDTSGCVGCGRCITWCPVGIDLTSEIPVIRESDLLKST